jgi:flagellar biosynthetic protein FliR
LIETWVIAFCLILARVSLFIGVFPLFGGKNIPRTVKVGLAIALAVTWFGTFGFLPTQLMLVSSLKANWLGFPFALAREAVFGAILGFAFGLFLLPARIAGAYAAQEMGLNMATLADPTTQDMSTVLAQVFEALGVLLFFSLDFHHILLSTLHLTFVRWPIGGSFSAIPSIPLMDTWAQSQEWGMLLAAPLGLCLFLTAVALALMMKVAPQLNLMSVGMTVRLCIGLVVMMVFMPDVCLLMRNTFYQMTQFVHGTL